MTTKATAQTPRRRPAPKPKPKPPEVQVDGTVITVDLDGAAPDAQGVTTVTVVADFAPTRRTRIMRQVKQGNIDVLLELIDMMFGDQVAELEDRFDLETDEDWGAFIQRIGEAANPNSTRS